MSQYPVSHIWVMSQTNLCYSVVTSQYLALFADDGEMSYRWVFSSGSHQEHDIACKNKII